MRIYYLLGLGLVYKLCPGVFKKLTVTVNYLMIAIGNVISLIVISCGWFPAGHLFDDYRMVVYFFSLAIFALFGLIVFLCVVPNYGNHPEATVHNNTVRTNIVNAERTEIVGEI